MTPERLLERPRELKPAFDISSYWNLAEGEIKDKLIEDLPSYVIEQGDLPDREKTTTGVWQIKDGEIFHPTLGPVASHISQNTHRGKQEYEAFLKIRDYLVKEEGSPIVCWFSPVTSPEVEKENYTESRIVVYLKEEKDGEKKVKYYEFTGQYSFEEIRQIANSFRDYSREEYFFPSLESLRTTPICLQGINLEKVVGEMATYPEAWEDLVSDRVSRKMSRIREVALEVAEKIVLRIEKRENPIFVGAGMEQEMARRISWNINPMGGCGYSNSFLLGVMGVESVGNFQNHYSLALEVEKDRVSVLSFKKEKKFSGQCPVCHKVIPKEKAISPGERCPFCNTKWECY